MPARPTFMREKTEGEGQDKFTPNPTRSSRRAARRLSMASSIFSIGPGRGKDAQRAPRQMPAALNIARCVIYIAVLIWAIIVMAIAAHLHSILQASELTTFLPFSIFVAIASMIIFPVLLGFSFWKRDASPISARIEFGCLGLAGTLWMALGAFMISSEAGVADVECYASEAEQVVIEVPGFSTETFHAQYRVMEAFALFNAILVWGFLLLATWLALRQHWRGNTVIWSIPVTALAWASSEANKLPPPVTSATRSRSMSKSPREKDYGLDEERGRSAAAARRPTFRHEPSYIKDTRSPASTPDATPDSTPRGRDQYIMWMPHVPKTGTQQPPAEQATPPQRSYSQRQLARQDSRGQPTRQDSRGQPSRQDSRGQPSRQDSRGQPSRQDSRSQPQRSESQRRTSLERNRSHPPAAYRQTSRDREGSRDRSLDRNKSHPPRVQAAHRSESRGRDRSLTRNESHPPRAPPAAYTTRAPVYDQFQRSGSSGRPGAPQRKDTWGRDASPRRR